MSTIKELPFSLMKPKRNVGEIEFHDEIMRIHADEEDGEDYTLKNLINEGNLAIEENNFDHLGSIFKQLEIYFLCPDRNDIVLFLKSQLFKIILSFVDNVDGRDVLIFYVADILTNLTQNQYAAIVLSRLPSFMEVLISLLLQHKSLYAQAICPIIHNMSFCINHFHGQWGIALLKLLSKIEDESMKSLISATLMGISNSRDYLIHLPRSFFTDYIALTKNHLKHSTEQCFNLVWGLYNMFNNPGETLLFGGVGKNLSTILSLLLNSENILLNQIGLSIASHLIIYQSSFENCVGDEEVNYLICQMDDIISEFDFQSLSNILSKQEDESAALTLTLCTNLIVNQFSFYYRIIDSGIINQISEIAEDSPLNVKREIGAFLSTVIIMSPKYKLQEIVSEEYYNTIVEYAHLGDDRLEELIYEATIRMITAYPEFIEVVAESEYVDFLECREADENTPLTTSYSALLERIEMFKEQS